MLSENIIQEGKFAKFLFGKEKFGEAGSLASGCLEVPSASKSPASNRGEALLPTLHFCPAPHQNEDDFTRVGKILYQRKFAREDCQLCIFCQNENDVSGNGKILYQRRWEGSLCLILASWRTQHLCCTFKY